MREIRPFRTDADHEAALAEMGRLWGAPAGTPDGARLDVLATLVDAYESERYPMDRPHPIEAAVFRMEQLGPCGSRGCGYPACAMRRVSRSQSGRRPVPATGRRRTGSRTSKTRSSPGRGPSGG